MAQFHSARSSQGGGDEASDDVLSGSVRTHRSERYLA